MKKSEGSIRICGDCKVSIIKVAKRDKYHVPKTEDFVATLNGEKRFSKLVLYHAYQQLLSHEDSRELLTVNTQKGLFEPNRLQYEVHSAVGNFQREMEKRLSGIPFTIVRIYDILISGKSDEEHLQKFRKTYCNSRQTWDKT